MNKFECRIPAEEYLKLDVEESRKTEDIVKKVNGLWKKPARKSALAVALAAAEFDRLAQCAERNDAAARAEIWEIMKRHFPSSFKRFSSKDGKRFYFPMERETDQIARNKHWNVFAMHMFDKVVGEIGYDDDHYFDETGVVRRPAVRVACDVFYEHVRPSYR